MKFITYTAIFISFVLSAQQLVVNPDFSQLDKKGKPIGWKCDESIRIISDEDGQNKAVILNVRNAPTQSERYSCSELSSTDLNVYD